MHSKIIKLLILIVMPLLLGLTRTKLTEEELNNNRDYYEVINATTGKKIEKVLYAEERVIETHIKSVLAIKEALTDEGIDPSQIRVLLYYDGLTIDDSSPPRIWQNKPHPDTISSPWLDLTRTISIDGESKITVRIDATAARLMLDLYSEPEYQSNIDNFLSIHSIRESCFARIVEKYEIAYKAAFSSVIILPLSQSKKEKFNEYLRSLNCLPKELREPMRALIKSSNKTLIGTAIGGLDFTTYNQLFFYCQDQAQKYYSELYAKLAIQGLRILESRLDPRMRWWIDASEGAEAVKECQGYMY
ncbi:MAG: hypothetical protein AAFQ80_06435 [Cyanobacteria bacterium J06621_8]